MSTDAGGAQAATGRSMRGMASRVLERLRQFDVNPETAFKRKRPPPAARTVVVNQELPADAFDKRGKVKKSHVFVTNQIVSAKYTLYNFPFKNLLEQFRRVANIFFLVLVILQFFPQFTTISPGVAMLPLLIVLAITMIKDGYEDIKRHQSDRNVNRQRTLILTGGGFKNHNHTESKSRSVRVFIELFRRYLMPSKKYVDPHPHKAPRVRSESHIAPERVSSPPPMRVSSPPPMSPITETGPADFTSTAQPSRDTMHHNTRMRSDYRGTSMDHQRPTSRMSSDYRGTSMDHQRPTSRMSSESRSHSLLGDMGHHGNKPHWRTRHWEDVHVGDIVYLRNNDPVPADVLICATSEEDGSCYVETKNLDGEINLKSRFAVPELMDMRSTEECLEREFDVEVEPQNVNMYRFNARVTLRDEEDEEGNPVQCPVTLNQVLLRGCSVRNTDWVIGVVLMTGMDSKIVLNSGDTPSKRSLMERKMNEMVYVNLGIIGVIAVVCAIADAQLEKYYHKRIAYWEYLSEQNDDNPSLNGLVSFANSLITFQNFVPIALYISFEVVRTVQALLIFEDRDMYYEKTSRRTFAKSWNLSDELGQIEYIISDKTGTLTQNIMIFRGCAIDGQTYHGDGGEKPPLTEGNERRRIRVRPALEDVPQFVNASLTAAIMEQNNEHHPAVERFFRCLALCHTVHVASTDERNVIMYRAESPDEQALVQTAADNGYVYCGRHINTVELQVPNHDQRERFEILHVLEFSSARKRMSVILRSHKTQRVIMYSKGADSMIYSRLGAGQDELKMRTDEQLEDFANKGLRTLCVAQRELEEGLYKSWAQKYQQATVATEDREERMEELASELERELTLLGATAIEDRLQDGVPETIADLKRAGIKIWVATGDKLETAIAIGYSTKLLASNMNLIIVRGGKYGTRNSAYDQLQHAMERFFESEMTEMEHPPPPLPNGVAGDTRSVMTYSSLVGEDNGSRPGGFALVIDGYALDHALSEPHSRELLDRVARNCRAVVCCRVSPLQKALIVNLVKQELNGVTLAIGDGANDVSMIQAAQVGVGVAGEEGLQAVNSADYAIGQFRFLKRLLLVHGHWSYYRNSKLINLFFYKQVVHTGTLFWFQIYCAWSTTQAFEYIYLLLYNAIWTVAPVVGIGIFDRNVSARVLMDVPELYTASREHRYFSIVIFLVYMLDGLYQSVVLYFFFMYAYDMTTPRMDGYSINLYEGTTGMVIATVLIANLYCGIDASAWTWWIFGVVWAGPLIIFIFAPIYASFNPDTIWTYSWGNNYKMYRDAQFWFIGLLTVFLALLPRLLYGYLRLYYFPTDLDIVRIMDARDPNHDYINDPLMPGKRAARAYESENEVDGDVTSRSMQGDTYPLMPTQSRTSSTQFDMSTGEQTPYRGYSFAASDLPIERPKRGGAGLGSLGRILHPGRLRRRRRNKPSNLDLPYQRLRDQNTAEVPADSVSFVPKRESFLEESVMNEESDPLDRPLSTEARYDVPSYDPRSATAAAPAPSATPEPTAAFSPRQASAYGTPRMTPGASYAPYFAGASHIPTHDTESTMSDTFFSVLEPENSAVRHSSGQYSTHQALSPRLPQHPETDEFYVKPM